MDVVGVSRARTTGSYVTKSGRKAYRGERRHWYVYYYDDEGKFRKMMINALQVPYYGSLIRRTKTYVCRDCGIKFRSMKAACPKCGKDAVRIDRGALKQRRSSPVKPRTVASGANSWSYQGTFTVEAGYDDTPVGQR